MQITVTNTNPLLASQVWATAWLAADPGYPFVTIEATSDQPGSFVVFEADQNDGIGASISAHQVAFLNIAGSGTPGVMMTTAPILQVQIRAAFYRVVYTNGATAQALFNFVLQSSTIPVDPTSARLLNLILRELRAQSHLLLAMKEPGNLPPDLPMGFDLVQGDLIPPGLQVSTAAPPQQPFFS